MIQRSSAAALAIASFAFSSFAFSERATFAAQRPGSNPAIRLGPDSRNVGYRVNELSEADIRKVLSDRKYSGILSKFEEDDTLTGLGEALKDLKRSETAAKKHPSAAANFSVGLYRLKSARFYARMAILLHNNIPEGTDVNTGRGSFLSKAMTHMAHQLSTSAIAYLNISSLLEAQLAKADACSIAGCMALQMDNTREAVVRFKSTDLMFDTLITKSTRPAEIKKIAFARGQADMSIVEAILRSEQLKQSRTMEELVFTRLYKMGASMILLDPRGLASRQEFWKMSYRLTQALSQSASYLHSEKKDRQQAQTFALRSYRLLCALEQIQEVEDGGMINKEVTATTRNIIGDDEMRSVRQEYQRVSMDEVVALLGEALQAIPVEPEIRKVPIKAPEKETHQDQA